MSRLKRKAGIQNEWIDVERGQVEAHGRRCGQDEFGILAWLAGDADRAVGVVELPLPLERDDVDHEVGIGVVVVDRVDGHERHREQAEHDHERDHDVRDLHRDVVVLLRRQVEWPLVGAPAVPHDHPQHQAGHEQEHDEPETEEQVPDTVDRLGLLGDRRVDGDHASTVS